MKWTWIYVKTKSNQITLFTFQDNVCSIKMKYKSSTNSNDFSAIKGIVYKFNAWIYSIILPKLLYASRFTNILILKRKQNIFIKTFHFEMIMRIRAKIFLSFDHWDFTKNLILSTKLPIAIWKFEKFLPISSALF